MPKIKITSAQGLTQLTGTTNISLVDDIISGVKADVTNITADTALTAADSGKTFVFNDTDGATITLPDSGAGDITGVSFEFALGVSTTSSAHKVVCADTTNERLHGSLLIVDTDTSDAVSASAALAADNFSAISSNGSTTGIVGSRYKLTNIGVDKWLIEGMILGNGAVATPLAVS